MDSAFNVPKIWRGLARVKQSFPCVLSFGNFDGVHLGHQLILEKAKKIADERGLPLVVICFRPLTSIGLRGQQGQVLQCLADKIYRLGLLGVDHIIVQPFNRQFRAVSAEQFLSMIFVEYLQARAVLVGQDCRFGMNGAGNISQLSAYAARYHADSWGSGFLEVDGQKVGSSLIRNYLQQNKLSDATALLGRNFMVRGVVARGKQLGRELNCPTVNLRLSSQENLLSGVFAVRVRIGGVVYPGVASWGRRPVVGVDLVKLLEVHIFDFSADVYGRYITVEFVAFIRDEQHFSNVSELKMCIQADIQQARICLAAQ